MNAIPVFLSLNSRRDLFSSYNMPLYRVVGGDFLPLSSPQGGIISPHFWVGGNILVAGWIPKLTRWALSGVLTHTL